MRRWRRTIGSRKVLGAHASLKYADIPNLEGSAENSCGPYASAGLKFTDIPRISVMNADSTCTDVAGPLASEEASASWAETRCVARCSVGKPKSRSRVGFGGIQKLGQKVGPKAGFSSPPLQ